MRRYRPDYVSCGISKWRYDELLAYCRQYPEKKSEAETLLCVSSPVMTGMPHGSGTSDPVARAAERREKLLHDCNIIENCARSIEGGSYEVALIQNLCYGKSYEFIGEYLPTSHRQAYFSARRKFFIILDKTKDSAIRIEQMMKDGTHGAV